MPEAVDVRGTVPQGELPNLATPKILRLPSVDGSTSRLPEARINYVVPGGIEVRSRPRRN